MGRDRWAEQRGGQPATPQSWSYSDQIRSAELVPTRKIPPARGWRRAVYKGTFGLVNLGQSPDERRQAELRAKVEQAARGYAAYYVGLLRENGGKSADCKAQ